MADPNPPFNWLVFLLGFAIALWLAIVVLFVLPDEGADRDPATVVNCGSGNCAATGRPYYSTGPLWIPGGGESYFCTNRQDGGGYVEDAGGGPVQDAGGYVEDAGGYVEDAGGYVEDSAPRAPAPSDDHLQVPRGDFTYHCETNNDGGGYVEDNAGRDVSVPMRTNGRYFCWKDQLNNAVVLRAEGAGANTEYFRTALNRHQDLLLFEGASPPLAELVPLPAQPPNLDQYVFCMVAETTTPAAIVNRAGECLGSTQAGYANCP